MNNKLKIRVLFKFGRCAILFLVCGTTMAFDLSTAYQKALFYNADYLKAQALNSAGQEEQVLGMAEILPQITVGGGINQAYLVSGQTNVSYSQPTVQAQLSQMVYDFGKISTYGKGKFATQLADLQFDNAKQKLIVDVGQSYFNLLFAEDSLEAIKMAKVAFKVQLEQATRAFNIGTVTIIDVNDVKSEDDKATAQEISAVNELINQKNIFNNITGQNPDLLQPIIESIELVLPDPDNVEQWVYLAKTGNLDIKIAQKQLNMTLEDINIAKSGHYPTLSFIGTLQYQGSASINGSDSQATIDLVNQLAASPGFPMSNYTSIIGGFKISIPLSSGGYISSQVRQQINNYEVARNQLLSTQRDVDRKVRYAFLQVHNGVDFVNAQSQALKAYKIKLKSDQAGYLVGIRSSINVVNAQSSYYQAWQNYNQARYQYLFYRLQLEYLVGRIDKNFLNQINYNIKQ